MNALRIEKLFAGYGASTVLHGVDLRVEEGESVAVVGRNGAGKSTLLQSVFRETRILSGEIWVRDRRIDAEPGYTAAMLGISISPQGRRILPNLTVYDLFPVLEARAKSGGSMLSGGQQQMLAIGRALMANPALLFLDEPSEGLSPVLVDQLVGAINEIRGSGVGVLVVEQHLSLVRRATNRFVILSKGEIVGSGATAEISDPRFQSLMAM